MRNRQGCVPIYEVKGIELLTFKKNTVLWVIENSQHFFFLIPCNISRPLHYRCLPWPIQALFRCMLFSSRLLWGFNHILWGRFTLQHQRHHCECPSHLRELWSERRVKPDSGREGNCVAETILILMTFAYIFLLKQYFSSVLHLGFYAYVNKLKILS
jgi:hypothetical protein